MLVSIITVSYNSEKTILNCINSVSSQDYKEIEHIVIDGKSKDNTLDIINSTTSSRFIKIVSEKDHGIYDAMNKGIKLAKGDIIGFLNSDDIFSSTSTIKKIVNAFNLNKKIMCCYGNLIYVKNNKVTRTWKSRTFEFGLFEKSWTPAHPTFYCKKSVFTKIGQFKTDYKIAADVEFMLRALEINKLKSYFIDDFLVKMSAGGISNKNMLSTIIIIKEIKRAFKENSLKFNIIKYLFYKILKIREFIN